MNVSCDLPRGHWQSARALTPMRCIDLCMIAEPQKGLLESNPFMHRKLLIRARHWQELRKPIDVVRDPLDEVRAVLVLHVQHLFINLLRRHAATEETRRRQVAAVTSCVFNDCTRWSRQTQINYHSTQKWSQHYHSLCFANSKCCCRTNMDWIVLYQHGHLPQHQTHVATMFWINVFKIQYQTVYFYSHSCTYTERALSRWKHLTRIRGTHHVLGIEHLLRELRHRQRAVLLRAARRQRREAVHEEMQAWKRDHVRAKLAQIAVELARETDGARDARQARGHEMVEVAVCRGRQLQRSEAYVIPKIARNHYRAPTSNELLKEKKR